MPHFNLRELGYPTIDEVESMGLTGLQFFDILKWYHKGATPKWWEFRKPRIVTGHEVMAFVRGMERNA